MDEKEQGYDVVRHTDVVRCKCGWSGSVTTYADPGENGFSRREAAVVKLTEEHRAARHPKSPAVRIGGTLNLRGGGNG